MRVEDDEWNEAMAMKQLAKALTGLRECDTPQAWDASSLEAYEQQLVKVVNAHFQEKQYDTENAQRGLTLFVLLGALGVPHTYSPARLSGTLYPHEDVYPLVRDLIEKHFATKSNQEALDIVAKLETQVKASTTEKDAEIARLKAEVAALKSDAQYMEDRFVDIRDMADNILEKCNEGLV